MLNEKRVKDTHLLGKRQDSPKLLKKNFVGFTAYVLFVERSGELRWLARLRTKGPEPKGNQVLIGRVKSVRVDPKPGDLPMSRMKLP